MREIKFRAWDTIKKKMWSAEELGQDQVAIMPDGRGFANISGDDTGRTQWLINLIPMQYTGLKDIKDKEAYDGHIISVIAEKHLIDGKYVGCVPFNAKIFWESNMLAWFYEELEYGEGGHPLANCKCEIIGNVHQPELLEKPCPNSN